MNFLPVAERELRIISRKPRTYYVRSLAALAAMLLGTVIVQAALGGVFSAASVGRTVFTALSLALYVGVCWEGAVTAAGCLSREQREGTLGILFLSNLKGYDVVAGKLGSALAESLYCILGTLPVMSFCFFLGGMSGTDFVRMLVALPNTIFFAAALGLLSSACTRSESRAISIAIIAVFAFSAGLPALGYVLKTSAGIAPIFLMFSPAGAFAAALGPGAGATPADTFGWSLLASQLMAWGFLALASYILPRSFLDQTAANAAARKSVLPVGRKTVAAPPLQPGLERKVELHGRLLQRRPSRAAGPIIFLLGIAALVLSGAILMKPFTWFAPEAFATLAVVLSVLLHLVTKYLAASQSCRALLHDRQGGELEMLLTTPLDAAEILRGNLLALKRRLLGPVLFVLAIDLLLLISGWWNLGLWQGTGFAMILFIETAWMLVNLYTLTWVGLWQGMKCQSLAQALRRTLVWVIALPWLGLILSAAIIGLVLAGRGFGEEAAMISVIWFFVLLACCNSGFTGRAMNELRDEFRALAAHQSLPTQPRPERMRFVRLRKAIQLQFARSNR
jgi:hypothetical protein